LIEIDEEFQKLIPPLSDDEFRQLEENCVKEGIRDPLVVWEQGDKDILVDGHNRWKISANHGGIQFQIVKKHFESRNEAIVWICDNQLGRRNIHPLDGERLLHRKREILGEEAHKRSLSNLKKGTAEGEKLPPRDNGKTRDIIGKELGVSGRQVDKLHRINEMATPQVKDMVRNGTLSVNQAYNSTFPKVLNPAREARKEHEEFREKAKEGMVDFTEAKKDKLNQEILYHSFVQDIYKATGAVSKFGLLYQTKDIEAFAEKIPQELKEKIILNIGRSINILDSLKKILERRKQ
jgi:hypothetical protein